MKLGYMTNAWGATAGVGKGITSVKDLYYQTVGLEDTAFRDIADAGFEAIEIFEGNLLTYSQQGSFRTRLQNYGLELLAVYTGSNFIFPEILPEELYKTECTCELAARAGAKYLTVGGGAVRHDGVQEDDYRMLAEALDRVDELAKRYGLIACYHPHLGTIVEAPREIHKVLGMSGIHFCPDCGHIHAAGGDAVVLIEEYLERICYLHLKDFDGNDFAPLGTGEVDVKRVLQLAASAGNIDCTVEAERIADPRGRAAQAQKFLSTVF